MFSFHVCFETVHFTSLAKMESKTTPVTFIMWSLQVLTWITNYFGNGPKYFLYCTFLRINYVSLDFALVFKLSIFCAFSLMKTCMALLKVCGITWTMVQWHFYFDYERIPWYCKCWKNHGTFLYSGNLVNTHGFTVKA